MMLKTRGTQVEFCLDLVVCWKAFGQLRCRILKFLGIDAGEQQNVAIIDTVGRMPKHCAAHRLFGGGLAYAA